METDLSDVEARVLGCLIEKEMATPEYYPLSLNALVAACNQKSNRDPAMQLDETAVEDALRSLGTRQLVAVSRDGRVARYAHTLLAKLDLSGPQLAVLCELLVRGPQTVGELRGRCERLHPIPGPEAIEEAIGGLVAFDPPLVARLPRQPGRKEPRYAHLLSGAPKAPGEEGVAASPEAGPVTPAGARDERIARLEEEVAALRDELASLRRLLEELTGGP